MVKGDLRVPSGDIRTGADRVLVQKKRPRTGWESLFLARIEQSPSGS